MYVCNKITVQMMVYNLDTKPFWRSEVDEIEKVEDISKQLPWFLECNPDRYPYWWAFLRFKIIEDYDRMIRIILLTTISCTHLDIVHSSQYV